MTSKYEQLFEIANRTALDFMFRYARTQNLELERYEELLAIYTDALEEIDSYWTSIEK